MFEMKVISGKHSKYFSMKIAKSTFLKLGTCFQAGTHLQDIGNLTSLRVVLLTAID